MGQVTEVDVEHQANIPIPEERNSVAAASADGWSRSGSRLMAVVLFPVLAFVVAGCWWLLYGWWGVFGHGDTPHFAFQKVKGQFDNPVLRQTLIVFIVLAVVYALVLRLLSVSGRMTRLRTVSLGVMVAAMGIGCVLLYPVGALDVFNYMAELKLTYHFDKNPYVTTFEAYQGDPFARHAFLVDVTLFYGPVWLLASWIPVAITGLTDLVQTLIGLKVFNLALVGGVACLIAWHRRGRGLRWYAAAIFLVNPLVMFEGVANAHNDVMLTVFLVGAVIALERRSPLAGPLLALSTLVKVYSAVLLPLFVVVALRDRWGWRRIAATVALTAVVVAIACAPFWGNGKLVGGLLDGLEESQGMDHVSPYSLAQQYEQSLVAEERWRPELVMSRPAHEILPQETQQELWRRFASVMVVATLALAASAWKGRRPAIVAAETLLVMFLTATNLYPWYLIPVIALVALRPDRLGVWYVVGATALGLVYYPMFVYAHFNTAWSRFEVHQFLALFLTAPVLLYLAARAVNGTRLALARRHQAP